MPIITYDCPGCRYASDHYVTPGEYQMVTCPSCTEAREIFVPIPEEPKPQLPYGIGLPICMFLIGLATFIYFSII